MKKAPLLLLATAAATAFVPFTTSAQTWQTVDDFQYVQGEPAFNYGLAVAPSGTLFAAGLGTDALTLYHGLVMSTADNGNTWSAPLDDFFTPGNNQYYTAIVADSAGQIYAAGVLYPSSGDGANHWVVRRSADGGGTWSTVNDFVYSTNSYVAQPNSIAADAAGNIYIAGIADIGGGEIWTVRKGTGGTNFTTVDSIVSSRDSAANGIFVHPTAGIFVAGEAPVVVNKSGGTALEWTVRRSTNGGAAWSTVDTFVLSSTKSALYQAQAYGIGADSLGNLYVVGRAAAPNKPNGSGYWHWIVRKSTNGGNNWSTVDDYQLSPTASMWPSAVAADSNGNLYVAGAADGHWIVRESMRSTGAWSTIDDFTYVGGATPYAIAANSSGNLFVGGAGNSATGVHWLVRKH